MSLKRNIKVLSLALVAVFAFSAMAAVSAQATAPRWTVGGATLAKGVESAFGAKSTGATKLVAAGLGITLSSTTAGDCTASGFLVGSGPGEPGKNTSVVLHCKNAEVVGAESVCSVKSVGAPAAGTIETKPLTSTLVWLAETGSAKVGDTLVPEAEFAELEITGAECPVSGKYKVTGNIIANVEPVNVDVTTGTLGFPTTPIKTYWTNQTPTRTKDEDTGLKMGASAAVFSSSFSVTLTSDALFGVEPG